MNTVHTINPEQAQRAIALLWFANIIARENGGAISPALIGGVGCGKTTAVKDFTKVMDKQMEELFKLWMCILSYMESSDIGGIPYPDPKTKRFEYYLPKFLPFDTEESGVIFGDEFDRATPEVQNAFLQVLLGGDFHGHKLSPNAYVILAMNGSTDMYTTELSRAVRTRICSLFISRNATGAEESYDKWALENGVHDSVRAFAKHRPDLYEQDDEFEELALCVSRSADRAGDILKAVEQVEFQTTDILLPCLAGCIGTKGAIEMLAIKKLTEEAPTFEEIWENPTSAKVPANPSILSVLADNIVRNHTEHDIGEAEKLTEYLIRLPKEWTAIAMQKLGNKTPNIRTKKIYSDWFNSNSMVIS